jgi:hypothetical protein
MQESYQQSKCLPHKFQITADKNHIFTAYMCRDKPNRLISLHLTAPRNGISLTSDVGPTVVYFSGVLDQDQGCMPSTLFEDEQCIERVCQLFDVEY